MKSIKKHPFPLLPRWLAQKRKEKQFRQKLSEYQELYLTDVIIENELLGTCVFEKDTRIKNFCDEWEETDSAGNPVSLEMIEANCSVSDITVSRSWQGILTVSLSGGAADDTGRDLLGCHAVIAEINYKTGEIEYGLEG